MMRKPLSVLCLSLSLAILAPVFTFAAEGTDAPTIRFLPAGTQEVGLSAGWMALCQRLCETPPSMII